ncbi:MAG: ABC transporter ATP-binding protein [Thermoleophilia bacterium]|nr:ABC transporter ATP-binding protein [Thermoleophilia bacterium]
MESTPTSGPATSVESDVVLRVEGLRIVLDPSGVDIDDDVSMVIHRGEVLGLVGESASGKTTVGTSLLDYQRRGAKIAGGQVEIDGEDVLAMGPAALRAVRGGQISYVPQDSSAALNPALRIGTQLLEILEVHGFGSSTEDRKARRAEMMAEVLLPSDRAFLRRYPHQLSVGQQQRVAIAMAFANRPKVIVLDEPTTALDVTTQAHVLDTVRDLTRSYGVAALYITHDLAVVSNLADRIAVMYAGRVVEIGTRDELFASGRHPYTRKLLASIPDITGERALRGIPGWAPRPGRRPSGCAFTPRCDWAVDHCGEEYPPVEEVSPGHRVRCWRHKEVNAAAAERDFLLRDTSLSAPGTQEKQVISVRDVKAFYQHKETLHDITTHLSERRCLSLVGESGSGKTTLARCIAGLHQHKIVGDIEFMGKPLSRDARGRPRAIRQAIQYIFQSPYSSLNPRKTIGQILSQPLRVFFDLSRSEMEGRMEQALEQVALDGSLLSRYPDQLSGGERQRVAIARGLAAEPTVLICDEVTSWLDVSVQAAIIELLAGLQRDMGLSMLFVTHNLALVRSISQEVAVMNEGRIVEYGAVDAVLDDPQADYTKKLLSDTPTV